MSMVSGFGLRQRSWDCGSMDAALALGHWALCICRGPRSSLSPVYRLPFSVYSPNPPLRLWRPDKLGVRAKRGQALLRRDSPRFATGGEGPEDHPGPLTVDSRQKTADSHQLAAIRLTEGGIPVILIPDKAASRSRSRLPGIGWCWLRAGNVRPVPAPERNPGIRGLQHRRHYPEHRRGHRCD
jgi:hypothetical protein